MADSPATVQHRSGKDDECSGQSTPAHSDYILAHAGLQIGYRLEKI
jgi:hypothetical protein